MNALPRSSMPSDAVPSGRHLGWAALLLCSAMVAVAIGWIGYLSSDDTAYYLGALEWLRDPPFAGNSHWTTRHPLELTLAAGIGLIGPGYAAMAMVALGWYAAFLVAILWLGRAIVGARGAWMAAILLATLPVVVANATTVSCDLAEAIFLIIGIRFAGDLAAGRREPWRAAVAGLAFAGAIFCRETTGLALFGLVPVLVAGRPIPRRLLIGMAIALFGLIGLEALYQGVLTGDPLNRWTLALHHDSQMNRAANAEGNFLLWPPIDPLLVLLVNDDFALLFWVAGAAAVLRVDRQLDAPAQQRLRILFALALANFLLVSALYTKLVLNPRYFMLAAVCAALLVGAWLDRLPARARWAGLAGLVAANLLLLGLGNAHPRWDAEALVLAAAAHPDRTVHTDSRTLHRAEYRLAWQQVANASAEAPPPGALLLTHAAEPEGCAAAMQRFPSPPTFWGGVVQRLGLAPLVPSAFAGRMFRPAPDMLLCRARA